MPHAPTVIDLPGVEKRPSGLLLDVSPPIPQDQLPRWALAGVTWVPWTVANLNVVADDCETVLNKEVADFPDAATALPFLAYQGLQCSTLSSDPENMDERLDHALDVHVSAAFANELMTGTVSGGPSFASEAVVITAGAQSRINAMVDLETHLAEVLLGGVGFIHVTPALLTLYVGDGYAVRDGDLWRTPTGHIFVADAGYDGTANPDGEAEATAAQAWVYASGPVFHAIGRVSPVARRNQESRDMERNIDIFLSERYGLVAFDPNLVGAVLVTVRTA